MTRGLILLLVVVLAGYLGTLIARDPGYVLITYEDYAIQTSLWVLVGLLVVLTLLSYLGLRAFSLVRRGGMMLQDWRANRRVSRAAELTEKGMRLLLEGEHERSARFLISGAENNPSQGLNYLAAARAANETGDHEARETYLRMAEEVSFGALARARDVVAAELALDRQEPDVALAALDKLKSNRYIATLKQQALRQKESWRDSMAAVSELKKADSGVAGSLEREAALQGFTRERGNDGTLHELFKSLSSKLRQDEEILIAYVNGLSDKGPVEALLRSSIRKTWRPKLVELYGESDEATLKKRIRTAERWRKQHEQDAAMQYCLGCLYEASGEINLAKEAFTRSVELDGGGKAHQRLALLLAQTGDFELSNQQLRLAMSPAPES